MVLTETYTLNNGISLPKIAFGTWQVPNEDAPAAVKAALDIGYRHIDTAIQYENEVGVGQAIRESGIARNEIFVTTKIPADVKTMWYRFSRREDDYCVECSRDGETFTQMRVCHMWEGAGRIRFGIYACSPEESSFKAVFTDMKVTECAWKAHDGQKPD